MNDSWNKNAHKRHGQLIAGKDITFSFLLAPTVIKLLRETQPVSTPYVLEIGCGTGVLTEMIAKHVSRIEAIDPSVNSIAIAKTYNSQNTNAVFHCESIEDFSAKTSTEFDMAVAHMVLHVIENIEVSLKCLAKLLKKSAILLFTIPHPCFWAIVKSDFERAAYSYEKSSAHILPFTISCDHEPLEKVPYFHRPLAQYSEILEKAGFAIQRLVEPFPDEQLMIKYNNSNSRTWEYPGFLIWVCKKL